MEAKVVGKNVEELMKKYNVTVESLAEKLNISKKDLEKKLAGEEEFFVSEVILITEFLQLDIKTVSKIFFSSENYNNEKNKNEQ